jgi:hypothetical protein
VAGRIAAAQAQGRRSVTSEVMPSRKIIATPMEEKMEFDTLSKQEAEHWKSFANKLIKQYPDLKDTEEERCAEMVQTYLEKVCTRVGIRLAAPSALRSHPTFGPYILSALAIFNDALVETEVLPNESH